MSNPYLPALSASVARLREVLAAPPSVTTRDAAIKRFELTFELAWKALQAAARAQGLICRSPRESLRMALRCGWLADEDTWLALMDDRNETVHTYDEAVADLVYQRLPGYLRLFEELVTVLHDQSL